MYCSCRHISRPLGSGHRKPNPLTEVLNIAAGKNLITEYFTTALDRHISSANERYESLHLRSQQLMHRLSRNNETFTLAVTFAVITVVTDMFCLLKERLKVTCKIANTSGYGKIPVLTREYTAQQV